MQDSDEVTSTQQKTTLLKEKQEILEIAYSLHLNGRTDEDKQSLNLDGDTCYEKHVETRDREYQGQTEYIYQRRPKEEDA